jgi:hypothetical protein
VIKPPPISSFLAPPPNLVSDAPLLQTGTQTSTLVDPANTAESAPLEENKKKLVCIDGWLILLAIGQLLGPLKFLIWFAQCWLEYFILRDHLLHVAFVLRKIEINSIVFRLRVCGGDSVFPVRRDNFCSGVKGLPKAVDGNPNGEDNYAEHFCAMDSNRSSSCNLGVLRKAI